MWQIVHQIPRWLIERLANKHGIDARKFSATSHVVMLLLGHLIHARSLTEICDNASLNKSKLHMVRRSTPAPRRTIEVFFRELKQTLQLCDFIGTNENAVKWQIWTGLLLHLLLYYFKFLSAWKKSFSRIVGLAKTGVWMFEDFVEVLKVYGMAGPPQRPQPHVIEQYLKGFEPNTSVPMG